MLPLKFWFQMLPLKLLIPGVTSQVVDSRCYLSSCWFQMLPLKLLIPDVTSQVVDSRCYLSSCWFQVLPLKLLIPGVTSQVVDSRCNRSSCWFQMLPLKLLIPDVTSQVVDSRCYLSSCWFQMLPLKLLIPGVTSQVVDSRCYLSSCWFQVLPLKLLIPGVTSQVVDSRCYLSSCWFQVLPLKLLIPDVTTQVVDSRCYLSSCWFQMLPLKLLIPGVTSQVVDSRCYLSSCWFQMLPLKFLIPDVTSQVFDSRCLEKTDDIYVSSSSKHPKLNVCILLAFEEWLPIWTHLQFHLNEMGHLMRKGILALCSLRSNTQYLGSEILFLFIFFHLGFTACQDYFTYFEHCQSLCGAKTGDPREKTPDHPQTELGLSHIWPKLGTNLQRWDDEWLRVLKISSLTTQPRATSQRCGSLYEANLSQRLTRWAYSIPVVHCPSVVIVHTFKLENISEANWPILIKLYR